MRTKLFLAALAGVALASCVTDKEYDFRSQNEPAKITFDSPVMYDSNEGTRANYHGEISPDLGRYSYPTKEDFQIYAVQHSGDFAGWANATPAAFNNTSVSYDFDIDGWAPKANGQYYFWPDGKMSFAACSPAALDQPDGYGTRTYGATGLTITNFKVPADASKQFDLMFSQRTLNQTSANMNHDATYYSGIPIQFLHALSSIRFSISNKSSYTVVLKKITLYGVYDTATFKENITEESEDYTKYTIVNGNNGGNVNPGWGNPENKVSSTTPYVAFDGNVEFPREARYVSDLVNNEELPNNTGNVNILLLLPQTLPAGAQLKIDYTVNGSSASKVVNLRDAKIVNKTQGNAGEGETTATPVTEWKLGTRYTYRLKYSAEAADKDKIYFSPKSDTWHDAGVAEIDLAGGN